MVLLFLRRFFFLYVLEYNPWLSAAWDGYHFIICKRCRRSTGLYITQECCWCAAAVYITIYFIFYFVNIIDAIGMLILYQPIRNNVFFLNSFICVYFSVVWWKYNFSYGHINDHFCQHDKRNSLVYELVKWRLASKNNTHQDLEICLSALPTSALKSLSQKKYMVSG